MGKDLTRRNFLKSSLAAGAGASAVFLAGCQSNAPAASSGAAEAAAGDIAWDAETDVLIAGAGAAGLSAAVAASAAGVKTTIIDCNEEYGGSFIICQGSIMWHAKNPLFEDEGYSPEREDLYKALTDPTDRELKRSDPEIVNAYLDAYETQYDFFVDNGVEFLAANVQGHPDNPNNVSGNASNYAAMRSAGLLLSVDPDNPGPGVMFNLNPGGPSSGSGFSIPFYNKAVENGAEFLQQHKLVKLYRDESGRCIGAGVETPEGTKNFKANKGVVLCVGAWKGAKWVRRLYDPRFTEDLVATGEPFAKYDDAAFIAGLEAGAALCSDNAADWHLFHRMGGTPYYRFPVGSPWAPAGYALGVSLMKDIIFVNKAGKRFSNEMLDELGDGWYNWALSTEDHLIWCLYDEPVAQQNKWTDIEPPQVEEGWAVKADTIADLAAAMGLPADAVEKTIADYNSYVDSGVDPEWGRPADKMQKKIDTPPFYALKTSLQIHDPAGGYYINKNCEVYDIYGAPISGLYACGETAGGFHLISSPKALIQGRIAAEHAAAQ